MIPQRLTARSVLGGCVLGLVGVSAGGGLFMSAAEGVPYTAGLWLVFSVITTIGFEPGPMSGPGQLIAAGTLVAAAFCWFGIVSVAVEVGLPRPGPQALPRQLKEAV